MHTQEWGSAVGYLALLLDLAAHYTAAPLLHATRYQASTSAVWVPASFWDGSPASRRDEIPLYWRKESSRSA